MIWKRVQPFGIALLALVLLFNCFMTISTLTSKRYSLDENGAPTETVYAPRMVEDAVRTEENRQAARSGVPSQYRFDETVLKRSTDDVNAFFAQVEEYKKKAADLRAESAPTAMGADGNPIALEDSRTWQAVIPEDNLALMLPLMTKLTISDTVLGYALLDASQEDLSKLQTYVIEALSTAMNNDGQGVDSAGIDSLLSATNRKLQQQTMPVYIRAIGELLLNEYLKPTRVIDADTMTRLQEEAAAKAQIAYIGRGEVLAERGKPLTVQQKELLLSLDMLEGGNTNRFFGLGAVLYLALAYGVLYGYLRVCEPELLSSGKQMLVLSLILAGNVALQWISYYIDPRIMTTLFSVLLCTALLSKTAAQAANITLALSFSLLAGRNGYTMFSSESAVAFAEMLISGQIAMMIASTSQRRGSLVLSGCAGGIAGVLSVTACSFLLNRSWDTIQYTHIALVFASSLIISVFCVGMMSVWENVFDVVTNARLHELSNINHPLLKKLLTSAPGTYQHSMTTASLAESAAEAIGANALLARTGAMYHDVGKLRRPGYFRENQKERNIHDTLLPEESAGYIIAHVKDAEPLLNKYHMPSAVRKIAREHHGTTLAAYFYYKALELQKEDGQPVIERLFRYPGGLPSSKESAIVMLADSCEAAVRSIQKPSMEDISGMIHKVIQGKLTDGQLAKCPLTIAEIDRIEKSFLQTFSGLMHERIQYPGQGQA